MKTALGYQQDGINRDSQAKAVVRGMTETALQLIDGGNVMAAAERLDAVADALKAYAKRRVAAPKLGVR